MSNLLTNAALALPQEASPAPTSTKTDSGSATPQQVPVAENRDRTISRSAQLPEAVTNLSTALWTDAENVSGLAKAFCALAFLLHLDKRTWSLHDSLPDAGGISDLHDFYDAFANLGYKTHALDLRLRNLEPRLAPCLFIPHGKGASPLVITRIHIVGTEFAADMYDPETNRSWRIDEEQEAEIGAGTAHFLLKAESDHEATSAFQRQSTGHSWFRALMSRFSKELTATFALSLAINALALATPLFIMLTYDRVIAVKAVDILPILIAGMAVGVLSEWALRSYRGRVISWMAARIDWVVGTSIVAKLFALPPVYVERAAVSAQIARIKTFEAIREFFAGSTFFSVLELPFVVVSIAAIGAVAGWLALVPLAMAIPFLVLFHVMRQKIGVAIRVAAKIGSMRQKFLISSLTRIEDIGPNGLSEIWQRKHRNLTGREQIARFRLSFLANVAEALAHALLAVAAATTLTAGIFMAWAGSVTAGGLVASMILVWRVLAPLYSLCTSIPRLEQIRNSIRQVNQLMEMDGEMDGGGNRVRLEKVRGGIEFADVGLRYSMDSAPVLSGINCTVKPGSTVIVTGDNGSGKTSLLKLIQGMYTPQSGAVRIDGFDIRQLDPLDLRRQVAYVPQNPDFSQGSIADNLRVGRPGASDFELWETIAQVGIAAEIGDLENGLETDMSEVASLKMRFLLSIGRALLTKSHLLLIDEMPNSLLAGPGGKVIKDLIDLQKGQRTVVMVVNRTDFMNKADLVIALKRGAQSNIGTPEAVRARLNVKAEIAV